MTNHPNRSKRQQTITEALNGKVQTVISALRVAADVYEKDAKACSADGLRISQQFERQAVEARELADTLEEAY